MTQFSLACSICGCFGSPRAAYSDFNISPTLVIEQLPTDLRERFTEMREMDLQVQSKSWKISCFKECFHVTSQQPC